MNPQTIPKEQKPIVVPVIAVKLCSRCGLEKDTALFYKTKNSKDGLDGWCKECTSKHKQEYYLKTRETKKQHSRQWRQKNPDKNRISKANWAANNPERYKQIRRDYKRNRCQSDLDFKLRHDLRNRITIAIHNSYKSGSAVNDLGCSISELITHLENLFKPGMSWDNYGRNGWHIDHIVPLAKFDLTDPEQFKVACHYTNLQPLWAYDNIIKSDN